MDRAHAVAAGGASTPRASIRRACCAWPIASRPTSCRRPTSWSPPAARRRCRISASRAISACPMSFAARCCAGLGAENFSLVISSYDRDAGSPRHMVMLKPSAIDPDALGRPADRAALWTRSSSEACRAADRRQCRAVPLSRGGVGQAARSFAKRLSKAWGTRWLVSTSRRTPDFVADKIAELAKDESVIARFIDYRTRRPWHAP